MQSIHATTFITRERSESMRHSRFIRSTSLIMRNDHGIEVSPQACERTAEKGVTP